MQTAYTVNCYRVWGGQSAAIFSKAAWRAWGWNCGHCCGTAAVQSGDTWAKPSRSDLGANSLWQTSQLPENCLLYSVFQPKFLSHVKKGTCWVASPQDFFWCTNPLCRDSSQGDFTFCDYSEAWLWFPDYECCQAPSAWCHTFVLPAWAVSRLLWASRSAPIRWNAHKHQKLNFK